MAGPLDGHLQQTVALWTGLMVAVGSVTALVMVLRPWWRQRLPLVVPLLVGVFGLGAAAIVLGPAGRDGVDRVLFGRPFVTVVPELEILGPGLVALGALVAVGGAFASFSLEAALLRRRRRSSTAGLMLPGGAGMPSRRDSIAGVARVARRPALFASVSLVSAAGEEALFRGVMLAPVWLSDQPPASSVLVLVLVQAVLFGTLHLAFGWRSVLAKIALGLALAVGALSAGLLLGALLPHLIFQARVLAQFHPRPRHRDRSLAHA